MVHSGSQHTPYALVRGNMLSGCGPFFVAYDVSLDIFGNVTSARKKQMVMKVYGLAWTKRTRWQVSDWTESWNHYGIFIATHLLDSCTNAEFKLDKPRR